MPNSEINLETLKLAINSVLDHIIEDLGLKTVPLDKNHYWDCPEPEIYDSSTRPSELTVGSLTDDLDFIKSIRGGQSADASYNLVHIAPLLRYIGETVKK
jgi:hypothetical protein